MSKLPQNPLITMGLAVVALAVFIFGWILLDAFLAPYLDQPGSRVSFQEIAQASVMERQVSYLGTEQCGDCHQTILGEWLESEHCTVVCESCHGSGGLHVEESTSMIVNTSADLCITCHEACCSRPDDFPQVVSAEHCGGFSCIHCHNPMCPDVGGAPPSIHTVYKGVDCRICHGTQGFHPAPADHAQRPIESCTHCHEQGGDTQ
ncbi:MAG: hypothetical protein JSV77_00140 [Dehalococcoidales bacterium]|nr:MAG: hypothetical protein JSV77_00140 [Dehalococcoidales bacterium]